MTKWYTTGEMIDRLKVGEVAQDEDGRKVKRFEDGSIRIMSDGENYSDSLLRLTGFEIKRKWRIFPNVDFRNDNKALCIGAKSCEYITWENSNNLFEYEHPFVLPTRVIRYPEQIRTKEDMLDALEYGVWYEVKYEPIKGDTHWRRG